MRYLLFFICSIPTLSIACDSDNIVKLGNYAPNSQSITTEITNGGIVVISTEFINELLASPTSELFNKHRYELYYLVAKGNKKALLAGLKSLAYILNNPVYITECDNKVEIYKKEEVAHALSRSEYFHTVTCDLSNEERKVVFSYYKDNKHLYQLTYDAPWEFDSCAQ